MHLPLRRFRRDRLSDGGSAYRAIVSRYPEVRGFRPLGDSDRFRFATNSLRLGPVMLTAGTSDGFSFQEAADGRLTMVCPLRGEAEVAMAGRDYRTGKDGSLLVTGFDPITTRYGRGFAGVFLTVELGEIERALASWGAPSHSWDSATREICVRGGPGSRLREAVRSCIAMIDASDDLRPDDYVQFGLSEVLIQATALALRSPRPGGEEAPSAAAGSRQVAAALAFIEANHTRTLRLTDIAAAVGVSPRALQAAFQRDHGCSPMQQVRESRLAAAHKALQQARPGETVAAVARAHGFVNLGDFSVLFRRRFGRMPSQVLRNID